jgi:HD-like signal output (HDOD) protein
VADDTKPTRKRVWSFDDNCLHLARFFLSDYAVPEEKANELAQAIQDQIENFLTDLDDAGARLME